MINKRKLFAIMDLNILMKVSKLLLLVIKIIICIMIFTNVLILQLKKNKNKKLNMKGINLAKYNKIKKDLKNKFYVNRY